MNLFIRSLTLFVFFAAACQSVTKAAQPASLSSNDAATMDSVRAVVAKALGRASVEFARTDLTEKTTILVLPPRLSGFEDRSLAVPIYFDIVLRGDACYVVRRETGEEFSLADIKCDLAGDN
ncbi:MAG: hypothetical protein AAGD92_09440 [Pseudomonadota bacterium]